MPIVSCDGLRFSGLVWTFNLPPSKQVVATIWHALTFTITF
jgi:hypothetical protein